MDTTLERTVLSCLKLRYRQDDFDTKMGSTLLPRGRLCMILPLIALPHGMFPVKNTRRLFLTDGAEIETRYTVIGVLPSK